MKHTIEITRKAHFYVQEPDRYPLHILFVIHGYAQLAEEFLKEFSQLKENSILVVAPEAISKFYNKEQKAVANWMTSHERLDEISDYVSFLNLVYKHIIQEYDNIPFSVLGFSQGVSTSLRWVCQSKLKPSSFYACSGSIPPELDLDDFGSLIKSSIHYYYGNRDKLLVPEKAKKQAAILQSFNLKLSVKEYDGRHEISSSTIEDVINLLNSI